MLSCCRAVPAAPALVAPAAPVAPVLAAPIPAIPVRDTRPSSAVGGDEQTTQTAAPSDPVLDAFDRLCVREVAGNENTVSTFLARFQATAAELEPNERIRLRLYTRESTELLKAVLADPQASKVCSLVWRYDETKDVDSIAPLLVNNCPELASLLVNFEHHSALDFVSSMLELPSNRIKVLEMPRHTEGDLPRFFAALGKSQVSALTLSNFAFPKLSQGLCEYLAKDLLVRLKVSMGNTPVPSEMMMSLAGCTCLAKLEMFQCEFSIFTHLPKSITKLVMNSCEFVGGVDWSFLAGSNVRVLDFNSLRGVDGTQLGRALAVLLRAKGLDELRFYNCDFAEEILTAIGLEVGRIKRLDVNKSYLDAAVIGQISLALQSPNNEMKELVLEYNNRTASSIESHLVLALRHPNCILAKLIFWTYPEHEAAAKTVHDKFHNRRALFRLLQGQQVRRVYCPLRRLPVEMFRLVGEMVLL